MRHAALNEQKSEPGKREVEVEPLTGYMLLLSFHPSWKHIMSIPPYLTSGASSRAHHAFIVALTEARSVSEEDTIVDREIRRAKESLSSRPSTVRLCPSPVIAAMELLVRVKRS